MGQHSKASRTARQLKRTARNALFVLTATSFAAVLLYAGIATYAAARNADIPSPTIDYWAQREYTSDPHGANPADQYANPSSPPDGTLRPCPATGCVASTCHAETGEPTPRW